MGPVVQHQIGISPKLTLNKTYRVNSGLALVSNRVLNKRVLDFNR